MFKAPGTHYRKTSVFTVISQSSWQRPLQSGLLRNAVPGAQSREHGPRRLLGRRVITDGLPMPSDSNNAQAHTVSKGDDSGYQGRHVLLFLVAAAANEGSLRAVCTYPHPSQPCGARDPVRLSPGWRNPCLSASPRVGRGRLCAPGYGQKPREDADPWRTGQGEASGWGGWHALRRPPGLADPPPEGQTGCCPLTDGDRQTKLHRRTEAHSPET